MGTPPSIAVTAAVPPAGTLVRFGDVGAASRQVPAQAPYCPGYRAVAVRGVPETQFCGVLGTTAQSRNGRLWLGLNRLFDRVSGKFPGGVYPAGACRVTANAPACW